MASGRKTRPNKLAKSGKFHLAFLIHAMISYTIPREGESPSHPTLLFLLRMYSFSQIENKPQRASISFGVCLGIDEMSLSWQLTQMIMQIFPAQLDPGLLVFLTQAMATPPQPVGHIYTCQTRLT